VSIGDRVRVAEGLHTVIAVSGTTVRLADTDGAVTDIGLIELSAAEDFEVVRASSRTPVPPATPLEGLPHAAPRTNREDPHPARGRMAGAGHR
jgi:hypothetical protein